MSYRREVGDIVERGRGDGEISSFEWRIPDFPSLADERGDCYDSSVFYACNEEWYCQIYPKGLPGTPSDWISLYLFRLGAGSPQTFDVTVGISGAERVENKRERRQEFSKDDSVCFWCGFCSRSELIEHNSRLMPGNELILSLDMKCIVPSVARGLEELQKALKSVLRSGEDSNIVIKVQGKEFRAHRSILKARSPVFEAMFSHDMVEKQSSVVTVEDCDPETFPHFLEHVYTGSVEMISIENVFSLYTASEKYDLPTLKKACAEFLKKNLTVACFCDAITLAYKYDDKELMERVTEFYCNNTLDIVKTAEWKIFLAENPTVGNDLYIKRLTK